MSGATTIAAIATPPGHGGIGIVRISGPDTPAIAQRVLGQLPRPRWATCVSFRDGAGQAIDRGLALYFPAPHSYTGEHVLELHGHGGPAVLGLLLKRAFELGAQPARPGEFSERAFLNGKLDLAQAEAVADLIASASESAARAAGRSLSGEFSARVHRLSEALIHLRLHIEAALDFPEEEIDFLADATLRERCRAILEDSGELLARARQGRLLRDGLTVVLAGPPNAGKSSLLNALAQQDSAIVSPIPGTTRDVLREHIALDGLPLTLLDTAGLRDTADDVESEGVRRARAAAQQADRVLLLVDDSATDETQIAALAARLPPEVTHTLVRNKIDLTGRAPGLIHEGGAGRAPELAMSLKTGAGLAALRTHLKACVGYSAEAPGTFSARRRHTEAIIRARALVEQAGARLASRQGELAAEELRQAHQALSEITGEFTPDDLLGRIFADFCVGK